MATTQFPPLHQEFLRMFARDPATEKLVQAIKSGERSVTVSGLWGLGQALAIASLHSEFKRDVLVLTASKGKAEKVHKDLIGIYEVRRADHKIEDTDDVQSWRDVVKESPAQPTDFCRLLPPVDLASIGKAPLSPDVMSGMMETFAALDGNDPAIVVSSVDAILRRVVPRKVFSGHEITLEVGSEGVALRELPGKLVELGYRRAEHVYEAGDFSVRGGIVDIFAPGYKNPVRVEFFGDEIESIREFEAQSQRSIGQLLSVKLSPAQEVILTDENVKSVINALERSANENIISDKAAVELLRKLRQQRSFEGGEALLPLLFDQLDSFFDYLENDALIVIVEEEACHRRVDVVLEEFQHAIDERPADFPGGAESFILSSEKFTEQLEDFQTVSLELFEEGAGQEINPKEVHYTAKSFASFRGRIQDLAKELQTFVSIYNDVILVAPNASLRDGLEREIVELELGGLLDNNHGKKIHLLIGDISSSIALENGQFMILGPQEIYGERKKQQKRRFSDAVASLKDLKKGDFVVHVDHGIGLYEGLKSIDIQGRQNDFLILKYKGDDTLYLPMDNLHLIQRYVGADADTVKVDKLGGNQWGKVKSKVRKAIREMATELLRLYAARQMVTGYAFSSDNHWMAEFEAAFEYEETDDQLSAISDVKQDMEKELPMDRLVCGDVGFGKTEVAMRAAFKATLDKKQVAVLVPTTVLAQQHLLTFRKRFKSFPIKIEMLSRYCTAAETKDIKRRLKDGEIDIVIGTHMLLGKTISFHDLGLIIIDEEQRFGVRHKEKLKKFRSKVDVLTLTATPIPRTLHMSVAGVRELSIINTAPQNRLPIKTRVTKFDEDVIRDAIQFELKRGGQVYFVHNKIEDIYGIAEFLQRLAPEARIAVGHGKLNESESEQVMMDLYQGKKDILVSTTIIESGLDIPNVNTIIVNRADQFGLAQLYQLRGRVGRERRQAYAYLLIPGKDIITDVAKKRLQVISSLTELGSGFQLAAHDMELRGSGNLLGAEQSGHMIDVGFDLYCKMIEETMDELQGKGMQTDIEPQITLPVDAAIPHNYIKETNLRLTYYQRLTVAKTPFDLMQIQDELADRFGHPPDAVMNLFKKIELRMAAIQARVEKIDVALHKSHVSLHESSPITQRSASDVIDDYAENIQFLPPRSLVFHFGESSFEKNVNFMSGVLAELGKKTRA